MYNSNRLLAYVTLLILITVSPIGLTESITNDKSLDSLVYRVDDIMLSNFKVEGKKKVTESNIEIIDEGPLPGATISISNASVNEGGTLQFHVIRSSTFSAQSVSYATHYQTELPSHQRALSDDFTAKSGTLSFNVGEGSKTISIATKHDITNEADNTFLVVLSNPTNGASILGGIGIGTIKNNDPAPNYSVTALDADEGNDLTFTISADRVSELAYNINYATSDFGASSNDYTSKSGNLSFGWNQPSKTVKVPTIDDSVLESDEGVKLTLSNASGGAGISTASAVANIINNDGSGPVASNVAVPPQPAFVPDPGEDFASTAVAVFGGQFDVDGSGAATYNIPIFTPKGVAGVVPQLSLSYSTQAGNGPLGLGWSVSGLSSITRCRQTMEQEGQDIALDLTSTDRFCLDGQKLVVVDGGVYGAAGTEYRPVNNSRIKVISYGVAGNGPSYFKVWNVDGTVSEYGNTSDSSVLQNDRGVIKSNILIWAVNEIVDNMGNAINFSYLTNQNNAEQVIDEIRYAPDNIIRFNYSVNRVDDILRYGLGAQSKLDKLLSSIESFDSGVEVRRLDLQYNINNKRYRLSSITPSASGVSLQPTTFTWSNQIGGYTQGSAISLPSKYRGAQQADLNGDGRQDLIYIYQSGSLRYLRSYLSNGSYFTQSCTNNVLFDADDNNEDEAWHPLDYNADGRTDVILARGGYWRVYLADNFGCLTSHINTGISTSGVAEQALLMDINADGLGDLVRKSGANQLKVHYLNLTGNASAPYAFSANSITLTLPFKTHEYDYSGPGLVSIDRYADLKNIQVGDFNGDGRADLVVRVTEIERTEGLFELGGTEQTVISHDTYIYTVDESQDVNVHDVIYGLSRTGNDLHVFDINADGLSDVLYRDANAWRFRINTGTRFLPPVVVPGISKNRDVFIADENLDGFPDLHYVYSEDWLYVARGTGYSFLSGVNTGIISDITNEGYVNLFSDVNGDGLPDHVFFKSGSSKQRVSLHKGTFRASPRITRIVNGFGLETDITYKALTDPGQSQLYSRGTGASELNYGNGSPVFDLLMPSYAVSTVSSSAPSYESNDNYNANRKVTIDYRYAGARMQAGGRGFLGFEKLITIDKQTNIKTETIYHQDYPYTGMPKSTEVRDGTNKLLQRSDNSYTQLSFHGGKVITPVLAQSTEQNYVLNTNGSTTKVSTVSTTNTWQKYSSDDNHANLVQAIIETRDGSGILASRETTTHQYVDDVSLWWLGRVTETGVTFHRPGKTNIERNSRFGYYPQGHANAGMLKEEIVEPLGNTNTYRRTLHCYDSFGNMTGNVTHSNHYSPQNCSASENTTSDPLKVYRRIMNHYDFDGRYITSQADDQFTVNIVNSRNNLGQTTRTTDTNNLVEDTAYDAFGRKYYSRMATGAYSITKRRFASNASQISAPVISESYHAVVKTEAGGAPDSFKYYDVLGREVASATEGFDGRWIFQYRRYDYAGRVIKSSEPHYIGDTVYWSTSQYDSFGRVIKSVAPDGTQISYTYSGQDTTSRTTDTGGYGIDQSKTETQNALGETVRAQDASGTINYSYNAIGDLARVTNVDGTNIVTNHDVYGRKTSLSDPNKGTWIYTYNALSETATQKDANGHTTTYYRDNVGRQTKRTVSGNGVNETTHFNYGVNPLLQSEEIVTGARKEYQYDSHGRVISTKTLVDALQYTESTTFNEYGQIFQQFDASGDNRGLQFHYQNGYLLKQVEARNSADPNPKIYYQVEAMDARGKITRYRNSNDTVTTNGFAASTGYLNSIKVDNASGTILDSQFEFDGLGNLRKRERFTLKLGTQFASETFDYDNLNRLTHVNGAEQVRYKANGNIDWKRDVNNGQAGYYCYAAGKPNAVSGISTSSNCSLNDYQYDANGNMTSGRGRNITYAHYDKPSRIVTSSGGSIDFSYGVSRERYKRKDVENGVTTTTYIIGNVEVINRSNSSGTEYRRTLGNVVHAVWEDSSNPQNNSENLRYLHKDHLGSIDTISNSNGKAVQKLYHDAWGKQQQVTYQDWAIFPNSGLVACGGMAMPCLVDAVNITSEGFTGHEHVQHADIIHMNGRIYDPTLGRFLQADPHIQAAQNSQSYNRYSYVLNNPLSYTDPNGFFFKKLFKVFKKFASFIVGAALVYFTGGTASFFVSSWYGAASLGAISGAVGAAANGGNILKGALVGAFSAAAFYGVGSAFGDVATGNLKHIGKIAAHGAVGGLMNVLQGGKFGHGFLSAGVTQAFSGSIDKISKGARFSAKRIIASAVLGGTASKLVGGKFANGAMTGAFSRAFNDEMHAKTIDKRLAEELNRAEFEQVTEIEFTVTRMEEGKIKKLNYSLEVDHTGKITGAAGFEANVGSLLVGGQLQCDSSGACLVAASAGMEVDVKAISLSSALGVNSNAEVSISTKITLVDRYGAEGKINYKLKAAYRNVKTFMGSLYRATTDPFDILGGGLAGN